MQVVRKMVGEEMWFLVPGVGAQGGSVESVMQAGKNSQGTGVIINSSRGIIFAKNPNEEAKRLRDEINASKNLK
jgi:orotidine-5'-phosphate decarboxylase